MRDTDPDPTDLIQRAQQGDREAYDELFANAAERLQLFIRIRLGAALRTREDSLDLVQETYLEAHKAFGRFAGGGDDGFARWLCRIAENRIRDRAEYHGRGKRRAAAELVQATQVLEKLRTRSIGPATRVERADQRERLAAAVEEFPREDREVLLMRFFEGLAIDAIADRTGLSATSVRRTLGRATLRLGQDLGSQA